jgi:CheY-like chemotaxis protein
MPVMGGLEAIRAIRAREAATGRVPVRIVVLSANAMREDVRLSLEAGADGHLAKPISAAALLDTVAKVLGAGESETPRVSRAG